MIEKKNQYFTTRLCNFTWNRSDNSIVLSEKRNIEIIKWNIIHAEEFPLETIFQQ